MMETKLARISQLSTENPNMVFTSVGHLINKEMVTYSRHLATSFIFVAKATLICYVGSLSIEIKCRRC